jgi:molecular chaperone HtpG
MSTGVEQREFQAEARQLLQLMIHSIYSNKDIFLRELISNASDALDKLRLAALTDADLTVDTGDLHIDLEVDHAERTLTVRDNGIGMSHDEVVTLIGTIAKSGTAELLAQLKEAKKETAGELIGQFGVGFYSTFMVADTVTLVTRKAGEDTATRWASDGGGTYTVETVSDVAGIPNGTAVTVHLRPEDTDDNLHDYTAEYKLREIVKRYSDFIAFPIRLAVERRSGEGDEVRVTTEVDTLNSMKALWARNRDEVADSEYHDFYRHISHDWTDPLSVIRMRAEGTFEYEALLFLPSHAPFDLYQRDGRRGIQLYVKRVFIMDDCPELIPEYLRFVKGVVDAADLSLNISREILQKDRHIAMMRRRLVRKVLSTVKELMADDAEKYATFWREFGPVVKEGLLSDTDNRAGLLEIASFATTHDAEKPTTLRGYVERMPEGQTDIYYSTGESRATIENSPHLEGFRAKGFEVLLLTDRIDEVWVDSVPDFDGHKFQSIAKGQVDLSTEEADAGQREQDFAPLVGWLSETLKDHVKEVRLSTRLTTSPACVVSDTHDVTPALERMYRAMGQDLPHIKRILEVNPGHPLITGLQEAHGQRPDDATLTETAELLYGMAVLAEGSELSDPARFTRLLANHLAHSL